MNGCLGEWLISWMMMVGWMNDDQLDGWIMVDWMDEWWLNGWMNDGWMDGWRTKHGLEIWCLFDCFVRLSNSREVKYWCWIDGQIFNWKFDLIN